MAGDSLDKMMANTGKLFDLISKAEQSVNKEKFSDVTAKGGGEESLSDRGDI